MKQIPNLPSSIAQYISGKPYTVDDIGRSGSAIYLFDDCVLKVEPHNKANEQAVSMMRWLNSKLPTPAVLAFETNANQDFLLMSRVDGQMACDLYWLDRFDEMVTLLAEAIRMLWQVDISDCPRYRGIDEALLEAKFNVKNGLVDVSDCEAETYGENGFADPQALLEWLKANKPPMEPVLSHGDLCLPNVFFKDGKVNGFIDLNHAAVSDKWNDLALCWRSLKHNMDGTYGSPVYLNADPDLLFEKLGIEPNREKLRYYILLDELF